MKKSVLCIRQYRIIQRERFASKFFVGMQRVFAVILDVLQENAIKFQRKISTKRRRCNCAVLPIVFTLCMCLSACGMGDAKNTVSEALHLDVSGAEVLSITNSHSGFHGDGTSTVILKFQDDALLEQLAENEQWHAFPLNQTVEALAYGISDEGKSIGPFLGDIELPEITNGYYCLIDRHSDQETDILERASFNFTLGIYNADTSRLYFCQVDT